mgnify:CR=1 FL=1
MAIVDSGLRADAGIDAVASRRFESSGGAVRAGQTGEDLPGHGTRIAQVIHSAARAPLLWVAQALDADGRSSAAAIAAAIDWALAQSVQLIHLSVGLAQDRPVLARAIEAALRGGVLIVASSPARGAKPFPAAYAGVLAASGDARCDAGQISHLGTEHADFGGCPHGPGGAATRAGGLAPRASTCCYILLRAPYAKAETS